MPTYINRTGNSNKMWKYTFLPNSAARIEWGRIGLEGQEQIKEFGSDWERDRAIQKLVGEKLRKGYEESSEQDLRAEVKTAQTIGHKNQIARLEWVSLKGRIMSVLSDYDPSKYVYVEVMDSWSRSHPPPHLQERDLGDHRRRYRNRTAESPLEIGAVFLETRSALLRLFAKS